MSSRKIKYSKSNIIVYACISILLILTNNIAYSKTKVSQSNNKAAARCFTTTLDGDVISCQKSLKTSLVVDAKTGKVLHSENAHATIDPASLTKLITLYVVFREIESGRLSLDQEIKVSRRAQNMPNLRLGLKEGDKITVKDAIMGTIIRSGNDTAVALSEAVSGSEKDFASLMTRCATRLGMKNTKLVNSSGWYHPNHKTTAYDLAKIAIALKRDFPQYYGLFASKSFNFRGRTIYGHNRVVANYPGAEGMKTGFHNPAGSCIVTAASRGDMSLIGIVTGSPTSGHRDIKVTSLLDRYFGVSSKQVSIKDRVTAANSSYKANKKVASISTAKQILNRKGKTKKCRRA